MGILANTVSFCQYQVFGDLPAGDPAEWAGELLAKNAFRSIDNSAEETAAGWVALDDPQSQDFSDRRDFLRHPHLCFTLRRDQRRVPAALLRRELQQAEEEFLAAHPGLQRVPKQKREELREAVKGRLLARTLPIPSLFDAVWDTESGILTFTGTSPKVAEIFEALFRQTFENLRLVARHPFARARQVVPETLHPALDGFNPAGTDAVLELIKENAWVGHDFLRWLLAGTVAASGEYRVNQPGPALASEPFVAFLDNRLVLAGGGAQGPQRITVAGPQEHFPEARAALAAGKEISEGTIHLEKGEHSWKTTLMGELFQFRSFKAPAVKLEKDEITDEKSEREALFYERMHVLSEGLQLFDSLFATFLGERLAPGWPEREKRLNQELIEGYEPRPGGG